MFWETNKCVDNKQTKVTVVNILNQKVAVNQKNPEVFTQVLFSIVLFSFLFSFCLVFS